ncbi:hypothetical protein AB0M54_12990 [Actinoplanes sp. NPDC051470]|uniref:hypothetical protein n=1 Tax=Actinoplanes sp. NPDC051470 TaxID=3157224 RepID=UPI00343F5D64
MNRADTAALARLIAYAPVLADGSRSRDNRLAGEPGSSIPALHALAECSSMTGPREARLRELGDVLRRRRESLSPEAMGSSPMGAGAPPDCCVVPSFSHLA